MFDGNRFTLLFQKEIGTCVFLFDPSLMCHTHQKAAALKSIIVLTNRENLMFETSLPDRLTLLNTHDQEHVRKYPIVAPCSNETPVKKSFRLSILVSTKSVYIRQSEICNSIALSGQRSVQYTMISRIALSVSRNRAPF